MNNIYRKRSSPTPLSKRYKKVPLSLEKGKQLNYENKKNSIKS